MPIFKNFLWYLMDSQQKLIFITLLLSQLMIEVHTHKFDTETSFGTFMIVNPESTDAPTGDEVQLQCELNLPPEKVEFLFRPQNTAPLERDITIDFHKMMSYNITTKERLSKLHVYVNQKTVGDYRCVAWFGASAHSSTSAKLRIASIHLEDKDTHKSPVHIKIAPKNSIILRCGDVTSVPDPVWSFYKDDILLPTHNQVQSKYGGYILKNVNASDSGVYSCSAMNTVAGVEIKIPQRYVLHVTPTSRSPPTFLLEPITNFSAKLGENVLLECSGVSNPIFTSTWSRPLAHLNLNDERITVLPYGLQINNVSSQDEGTYFCRLDNGENNVKIQTITLNVLQMPRILKGPSTSLTNESDSLELECHVANTNLIYWMINGMNTQFDPLIKHEGHKIHIFSVEKKHAGIVQCFAQNELGEVSEGALLQVEAKQIDSEGKLIPLGMPHKSNSRNNNRVFNTKRKNRGPNLPSISKPNITRLSDESVMVKWSISQQSSSASLPIQFFKVQYIAIPYESQQRKSEDWITLSEDISPHLRSYEIHNLKPDKYKFRISAVYSNNDNRQSPIRRFHLRRLKHDNKLILPIPTDIHIEPLSETEVKIKWSVPESNNQNFGGFYISYRLTTSADDYLVVSCEGPQKRQLVIKYLEPGMIYEFKIQSFSSITASEFSSIVTGRTLKPTTPSRATTVPTVKSVLKETNNQFSLLPFVVGAIGCSLLFLLFLLGFITLKKHRDIVNQRNEQESKGNQNHIQTDAIVNNKRHLNGIIRINITPNPLSEEKNDMNGLGIPISSHQQLPPLNAKRKTLEKNIRNTQISNGATESAKAMIEGDLGIPIRTSSIKRQTLNTSNNNNSPRIKRNHHRVQRSPLPTRTKRIGDIGHSTASLNSVNSIEV